MPILAVVGWAEEVRRRGACFAFLVMGDVVDRGFWVGVGRANGGVAFGLLLHGML